MKMEPLIDAVAKISAKTPVGSTLRTADWERVPLALRERAQFSAGVESVRLLQAVQDRIAGQIKLQREQLGEGKEATFDRSSFIDAIREIGRDEGLTPQDPSKVGGLQDITSIPRLGLIYDMQTAQAQGFARWKLDQSEGALLLYPAQEFRRVEGRKNPREDWPERFAKAAQAVGDVDALRVQQETGRMIALRNSGLWSALSRFGTPWPPFDFGSGMGLEDIDRDEAVALGLIGPNEIIDSAEQDFNDDLQASAKGLSEDSLGQLKKSFGQQIKIEGDAIWWKGDRKGKALVKPKAVIVAEPDPAPIPSTAFPETLDGLETMRGLGGSTGATLVRDKKSGQQFVLKRGNSVAHIREEFAADQIYRALGVPVPEAQLFEDGTGPAKLARFVEGQSLGKFLSTATAEQKAATMAKVREHFAADALLGNWDVAGLDLDNILVDAGGTPWRIDNGGALRFRAQGAAKTAAEWNEFPTELWSLRDATANGKTAQVFDGMSIYDIARQIGAMKPEALDAAPAEVKAVLAGRLAQLKSIGAKALEYEASQFIAPHADRITREVMRLRESGISQQLTPSLKMANPNVTKGGDVVFVDETGRAFDHLRSQKSGTAAAPADKSQPFYDVIVNAAKTVNGHHAQANLNYNAAKLDAAVKLKPTLAELAKSGSATEKKMAAHYLDALANIEKAQGNLAAKVGTVEKFKLPSARTAKEMSLVERLADHMDANGGDWKVISDWASEQASSSRSGQAMGLKRWLFERLQGVDAASFHQVPDPAYLPAVQKKWGAKYDRSFEMFHAFMQEMLATTEFPGNDTKNRVMRILRTENTAGAIPFAAGKSGVYRRGVNESGSVATAFSTGERTVTIVPHARITSSYFMERTPGKGGNLLLGDSENEFTYMAHGLKTLNLGKNAAIKADAGSDQSQWPNP